MKYLSITLILVFSVPTVQADVLNTEPTNKPCNRYPELPEKKFTELARQQITVEGHVFTIVLDRRIAWFDEDEGEDQVLRLTVISDKKKSRRYFVGNRITLCTERWQPYLSVERYLGKDFLVLRTATGWAHYGGDPMLPLDANVEIRILEITSTGEVKRRLYAETVFRCYQPVPCSVQLEKVTEDGSTLALVWEQTWRIDREKHLVRYKWNNECWADVPEDNRQSTLQKGDNVCLPNLNTSASTPKFENPKKWL